MSKNFNVNIGRFRDICQKEGILSLLYLHVAFTSCNTTKIVAKMSFLANITATFARQLCYCICSANFGTAFALPTLALHLKRQLWHCTCSANFGSIFACKAVDKVALACNPHKNDQNITALVPIKLL